METCITCQKQTVSVIKTDLGFVCYNCYVNKKDAHEKKKRQHRNEAVAERSRSEAEMQSEFFSRVRMFFPHIPDKLIFAVPNGGSRNKIEAANLKRQGVKSGVADVIVLLPHRGFCSLCVEFKSKSGKQSDEQKEFQRQAEKQGSKYVIVRSVGEAIEELREYLS